MRTPELSETERPEGGPGSADGPHPTTPASTMSVGAMRMGLVMEIRGFPPCGAGAGQPRRRMASAGSSSELPSPPRRAPTTGCEGERLERHHDVEHSSARGSNWPDGPRSGLDDEYHAPMFVCGGRYPPRFPALGSTTPSSGCPSALPDHFVRTAATARWSMRWWARRAALSHPSTNLQMEYMSRTRGPPFSSLQLVQMKTSPATIISE